MPDASQMLGEANNFEHWISVALPEDCNNVCLFFKRETAESHIKEFGAIPLYGFDEKEKWLPVEVFITYGGSLAPKMKCQGMTENFLRTI